ncbi:conjugal transfer protein TraG N-terminal domain-containing protein [Pseudomonas sp. B392_1p]|uniref:conjugal transfer protein TraG N-terminal domain-containing protein n=1 Tax=Pseudomonas sp. B392_1p TaxID=3457507 RepID=UPI003FD046F1
MSTNSYLEFYLTLLGWIINNGLWNVLLDTGLFAAPLGAIILQEWLSARQQGADEGNKGLLSVARVENRLWLAYLVLMFACAPLLPVNLTNLRLDAQASQRCGISVAQPNETAWGVTFDTLGEQSANVPVWWYLVHTLSKGVTAAGTAAIPCTPDIRQIRMEIDETRIHDQVLLQEVADFTRDCYGRSRARLFTQHPVLSKEEDFAASWIGSAYFLDTAGFYDRDRSRAPRPSWPYDDVRDATLPRLDNGAGYPSCRQWWADSGIGLRSRLVEQVDPSLWTRLSGWLSGRSTAEIQYVTLRELVSPRLQSLTMSPGQIYQEYGGSSRGDSLGHRLNNLATNSGLALGALGNYASMNALRTALPMVQAFLILATIICVPLVLLISTYQLKVLMTLTFALFTLHMLTFWWELARWVDSSMLDTLYRNVSLGDRLLLSIPPAGFEDGTLSAQVIMYVMGAMFIVLPMLFLGAMSWAGYSVGSAMQNGLTRGSQASHDAGSQGISQSMALLKGGRK